MALTSAQTLPVSAIPKSLAAARFNPRLLVLASAMLGLVGVYRAAQPRTVYVLRAAHDIQPGQVLQAADLQVVAQALPDDVAMGLVAGGERSALIGRRLALPLYAGDLITRRQTEPVTRQLGPGERLYALPVPSETALGLHLQPADVVEIVVTTNKSRPEAAETHVVLPAVRVFSIGGSASSGTFGVGSSTNRSGLGTSKSTTLVLRTEDTGYQALARARQIGELDLSLVGAQERSVRPPSYRVALAVGEPHEARLLALLEHPTFQVGGRSCAVTIFCSTIREVRDALGRTESIDVVVMSGTLQAVPADTLRSLVATGRPLVVVATDPADPRWGELAVPVLGLDSDAAALAAAIGEALLGHQSSRPRIVPTAARQTRPEAVPPGPTAPTPQRGLRRWLAAK